MSFQRRAVLLLIAFLAFMPSVFAFGQAYTSIVVFGDSLSDTGNDATVSATKYGPSAQLPGPLTGYTNGRFTDGTDTAPAAHNYYGVWAEQLAALLSAKPAVKNSLAGGTNYAYGFATTNTGTSLFTYPPPNTALTFSVNNMAQQVSDYLATNPTITNKTLFIVWGGANDLIAATTAQDIQNAAMRDAGIVQLLINAGATEFIVPNLPPLGLVPRYNGSPATSVPTTQAAAGFDQALALYLAALPAANPGKTLHIFPLDTYVLFNTVVAAPSAKGFTNVTAKAQGNSAINPDTYLFWDDLHPTTYGHSLIAASAYALLGTPITTSTGLTASSANLNLNASVTLSVFVNSATGSNPPMGTLTITDGANVLSSGVVTPATGTPQQGQYTFTTATLGAGPHTIQASFTGANGYTSSTSAPVTVTVTAPALTETFSPSSITVPSGAPGAATLTLFPVGGYSGTATLSCGSLPAHISCSVSPSTLTLPGNNKAVTATVLIGTVTMASLLAPSRPGVHTSAFALAFTLFPGLGLLGLTGLRRRRGLVLTGAFVAVAGLSAVALTGCASNSNVAKGTYTVPIIISSNGTTTTQNLTVNVQ